MAKLTKRFVESLEPNSHKDYVVWDTELTEFAIRAWPSGQKRQHDHVNNSPAEYRVSHPPNSSTP
jgi:hypothetical protein